jgi:NADPH:quinone reductase-like Zn-dependent oxidoreductase
VVTALGYGTTGLSVGQRVFGLTDWHRDGTLAEYVAIEARNLGADRVIDYRTQDFTGIGPICDLVFDTVGGDVRAGCYAVLKPGGKLVWIAPAPEGFQPSRTDVETLRPNVIRDRAHLERMLALLDADAVRPPTIVRYGLADAAEAHRVSEARHLQGKLVLVVH